MASAVLVLAIASRGTKKRMTDPNVVGWFLEDQKSTRAGQFFFRDFFIVFLNSPHRETSKNVIKKNRENIGFGAKKTIKCRSPPRIFTAFLDVSLHVVFSFWASLPVKGNTFCSWSVAVEAPAAATGSNCQREFMIEHSRE
jgi:hypothetical protein